MQRLSPLLQRIRHFFLVPKVFPKRATLSLVGVKILVNYFVSDRQECSKLIRTPLEFETLNDLSSSSWINLKDVTDRLGSFSTNKIGLSGAVEPQTRVAQNLPTDCRLVSHQYLDNSLVVLSYFHECVNLILFRFAKMFISLKVTLTWKSGYLKCSNTLS